MERIQSSQSGPTTAAARHTRPHLGVVIVAHVHMQLPILFETVGKVKDKKGGSLVCLVHLPANAQKEQLAHDHVAGS